MNSGSTQSVFVGRPGNIARHVVEALFRHRTIFAAVAGTILFLTFLVTIATPASYQSEMHILVRDARSGYVVSPERSSSQMVQPEATEAVVNSGIDLLRSGDVADVVVDPDWTKTPLAQRPEEDIRQHERSVADFAGHLAVEPLGKSNIIRVAYVTSNPHEATEALDRLLQAFLAKRHEIDHNSSASSLLASEAERYRQELDSAQQRLASYQQENRAAEIAMKRKHLRPQPAATKVSANELGALQSRVQGLENNYQFYTQKTNEARIADAMNQELNNVAVVERPTFSTRPYRPQVLLNFALGLVTALLFAFTAVFSAELGRDTVATPAEFKAVSSAEVPASAKLAPRRRRFTIADEPAFTDVLRPAMTYGALALSPTFAEDAQLPIWPLYEPERATAAAVMVEAQPRSAAAAPQSALAIEQGDPCHRRLHRPLNDPLVPARSNLSPSQRAQLRRPAASRESEHHVVPYVTYIVDPRS
jgi:uncharacterized protein involved in exopolysaccharide biosynthesis